MASDMFIKIGDVKGESVDTSHKGEIDILSYKFNASQQGTSGAGGGSGAGKVQLQDLEITKYVDHATPTLFSMCCDGSHVPSVVLTVRKAGGKQLEYFQVELQQAIISSIESGGKGTDDRPTEKVTINFAKIGMQSKPQSDAGAGGAGNAKGWDLGSNAAWHPASLK